ncbi:MAG: hypothetical protein KA902_05270 [Arenimonas sp.]|nr:hypothetical protein [Arenimonas sp.]
MPNRQNTFFSTGPLALTLMIIAVALTRLIPHPPNFSPIEAMALFGGAYFANRKIGVAVPLIAMLLSDIVLGLVNGGLYVEHFTSLPFLLVYGCIALSSVMGFAMRGKVNTRSVIGYSMLGSLLFFLVTNLGVYLTASSMPGSEACVAGIVPCYVSALPFFQWTVMGTLFYSMILFGGFALLRDLIPALYEQTV